MRSGGRSCKPFCPILRLGERLGIRDKAHLYLGSVCGRGELIPTWG